MGRPVRKNYRYIFLKRIFRSLFGIALITVPIGIFFMTCQLETITIEGNSHYTEEELIDMVVNKPIDGNTILLYGRYRYGDKVDMPFIEDISVEITSKNSINIRVYEKKIIGSINHMGGYFYFDRDGYVVESSNEPMDKIPLVTGLQFSKIVLYEKLEIKKESLFTTILNITNLIHKYQQEVNSIGFNKSYEITLDYGNIKVLLGKRETYDEQIAELQDLIIKAEDKKLIIDLTTFVEGQETVIAKPYQ